MYFKTRTVKNLYIESNTGNIRDIKIYAVTDDGEKLQMEFVEDLNINVNALNIIPKITLTFLNVDFNVKLNKISNNIDENQND